MTTEQFGALWLQYSVEKKLRFECSIVNCEKLARKLIKSWRIVVIQVIGQEFIAIEATTNTTQSNPDVLIHVALLEQQQLELTLRAKQSDDPISRFLKQRHL